MRELLRRRRFVFLWICILLAVSPIRAVVVHGRVTDPLGAGIANADVALVYNGKVIVAGKTESDGSYSLST